MIKILTNQESWAISGGSTTYFELEKRAPLGDSIFSYLFIIALEIVFCNDKEQSKYKRS